MQSARKPPIKKPNEKIKEDKIKISEDKLKKSTYNVTTPRDFVQRSSAADIYAQKQKSAIQKAPRKAPDNTKDSKNSPMKDLPSPSSMSQISSSRRINKTIKTSSKTISAKSRTVKDLPFVNVTVNSPISKRKLDFDNNTSRVKGVNAKDKETLKSKENSKRTTIVNKKEKEILNDSGDAERQRSKTRTLNDSEVKQLTPDKVDNYEEMMNLKQKLVAKPKVFYVDLDGDAAKVKPNRSSDEEVSYEDDFESYESDFDSYHSEKSNGNTSEDAERDIEQDREYRSGADDALKEAKDEESMLDSGSFDLRDQRSAKSKPAAMEFILEAAENDKVTSLDEGFQEGSSAVSSMKTVHVDVLDRPMFVDFNRSKENKRKRLSYEKMMQRAKDILNMVTLHEMSFTLFEMKPISYDLYMATFGRTNHTQIAVQTFDDGISQEVQTEEVVTESKWTQHPVKFSKSDVYLNETELVRKNRRNSDDYLSKFTFLIERQITPERRNDSEKVKEYKCNPLRVLLEQKHGVGDCQMLPYEKYKDMLNPDFSTKRLGRFLKKIESNVSKVLDTNAKGAVKDDVVKSIFPFSSGYVAISTKNVSEEKTFLKQLEIVGVIFSESKHTLVLTVHRKAAAGVVAGKCVICLWDVSVARTEPIKILIAIDNLVIGRYRGGTDGIFVAALDDGSMHLWDMSEVPTWRNDVTSSKKSDLVEINAESLTRTERDREWNLKNNDASPDQLPIPIALQACAYTSSAADLDSEEFAGRTVGLEFVGAQAQGGGRRVVGQICSLQQLGVLTIWIVVQEKTNIHDPGKAFWSKMMLEKTHTFSLTDHVSAKEIFADNNNNPSFNLNAGKKRMHKRKQDKTLARNISRQKSIDSSDRPASVASARKITAEKKIPHDWESGVVCSDLKILHFDGSDRYLVAKNCGEVFSCTRSLGGLKVETLCVSPDTSPLTCLEVSPQENAYFLAATGAGAIHLYSMVERRVLLTLDCRNVPPVTAEGPRADFKGRFVDAPRRPVLTETHIADEMTLMSVLWSRTNPCCVFTASRKGALAAWELTHSDIYPKYSSGEVTVACMAADGALALVTPEGEVQVHRLSPERSEYRDLFRKYVALL